MGLSCARVPGALWCTHTEALQQTPGLIFLLRSLQHLSSAVKASAKTLLHTHGSNTACLFIERAGIFSCWY